MWSLPKHIISNVATAARTAVAIAHMDIERNNEDHSEIWTDLSCIDTLYSISEGARYQGYSRADEDSTYRVEN